MSNVLNFTPLTFAAKTNNFNEFKRLVEEGADVNETCSFGLGSIHLAMEHEDEKIARYILEQKTFNVNLQQPRGKKTPLMAAIIYERQGLAQMLAARQGIDLTLKNIWGETFKDYLLERSLDLNWLSDSSHEHGERTLVDLKKRV